MLEKLSLSYQLFRESLRVLRKDREILVFPLLSGLFGLLAFASMVAGGFALGIFSNLHGGRFQIPGSGYAILFVWYVVSWTIALYFNVATIACARIRLDGGDPVVADGFAAANKHLGKILAWAVVSATVGVILQWIADRGKLIGGIVQKAVGAAWSIATYFIVPVLLFEERSLTDSVKQSTSLVKKTWGEALGAHVGIGFFAFLLALPGIALPIVFGMAGDFQGFLIGLALAVVYWIALAVVCSALSGIFRTALYLHAIDGRMPQDFSPALVTQAFVPK